jgi:L,D-peptidoglycan transpeptidase YkuD (ErfK/YbiS/YcfS/YnhG family)
VLAVSVAVMQLRHTPTRVTQSKDAAAKSPSAEPVFSASPSTSVSPSAVAPRSVLAARLRTLPSAAAQVIVVHAPGYSGTHATLETFTKVNGVWQPQFPAMAARIGRNGFADSRTEGDGTTPTGVYGFSDTMYGINPNPGVRYTYHRIVADDWWNENPDSPGYNTFQHTPVSPGGPSEALWKETVAYRYFAVVQYNIPVTGYARGSGVFLHVGTGRSTAGCISLAQRDLLRVLAWMDPAKSPQIVLSPDSTLARY